MRNGDCVGEICVGRTYAGGTCAGRRCVGGICVEGTRVDWAVEFQPEKNRTLTGPVEFVGAGADNHLPEGNSYRPLDCNLGG